MKIIDFETIRNLSISPADCVKWVETALRMKYDSCLPHKISMTIEPDVFFNTMPSYLPSCGRFGVKVVSRFPKREPALVSDILLYDATNGDFLALMDGSWITAMRTALFDGKSVNIHDFGVFSLSATTRGVDTKDECRMKNIKTVNINFRPSSSVRPNLTSTRAGEKIEFLDLDAPKKKKTDGEDPGDEGGGDSGGGSGEAPDPAA